MAIKTIEKDFIDEVGNDLNQYRIQRSTGSDEIVKMFREPTQITQVGTLLNAKKFNTLIGEINDNFNTLQDQISILDPDISSGIGTRLKNLEKQVYNINKTYSSTTFITKELIYSDDLSEQIIIPQDSISSLAEITNYIDLEENQQYEIEATFYKDDTFEKADVVLRGTPNMFVSDQYRQTTISLLSPHYKTYNIVWDTALAIGNAFVCSMIEDSSSNVKIGRSSRKAFISKIYAIRQYTPSDYYESSTKTLQDCSWDEIAELSENGMAQTFFNVGDEKTETLFGTTLTFVILGFNHDKLADGTYAGITFGLKETHPNISSPYMGDEEPAWEGTYMRNTTLQTLYNNVYLSNITKHIKTVVKKSCKGYDYGETIGETEDKLFLLSEVEITGQNYNSANGEGTQYEYYKGTSYSDWTKGTAYWTRSYAVNKIDGDYVIITANGTPSTTSNDNYFGVSYAFCI